MADAQKKSSSDETKKFLQPKALKENFGDQLYTTIKEKILSYHKKDLLEE